jgi:hypothetical protein
MRALVLAIVLALGGVAAADATVSPAREAKPSCTIDDTLYWRAASRLGRALDKDGWALAAVGRRHVAATQRFTKGPSTRVLRTTTLEAVASFANDRVAGVVEDAEGELTGLVAVDESTKTLSLLDRKGRLRTTPVASNGNGAIGLSAGDIVVIAIFHRIATGAALVAVDAKSGAVRWRGDVEQLNVAHSQYWNDVILTLDGNRVVMRGIEAGGCYEQTFDLATGRRLRRE